MANGVSPAAIRAARERAGLTQHQLAHLVGVAGGERISRWELGTSEPRPDMLVRLAAVLNVPTLTLIDTVSDEPDLRALRFAAGRTTGEAASLAHVSKPTYERWESGRWKRLPDPENLRGLAQGLAAPLEVVIAALQRTRVPNSTDS